MTVYIEDVLFENFLVTYLILIIVYMLVGQSQSKIRHILASVLGGAVALLYPLINISSVLLTLLKCAIGYIICLCAYKGTQKRQFLFYVLFLFTTAIYGGINLMISFAVFGSFDSGKLPTILVVFVLMVVTYLLKQCQKTLYKKKNILNFVYDVVIKNDDKVVKARAYLDTGNVLVDPSANKPVALMGYKVFEKLCKNYCAINLITQNTNGLKNGHYIKVKTATGEDNILVFLVDSIEIKNSKQKICIKNPMFALSKVKITGLDCDVILNANYLSEVKNV